MKIDLKIYADLVCAVDQALTLLETQRADLARELLQQALYNAEDAVISQPDAFD